MNNFLQERFHVFNFLFRDDFDGASLFGLAVAALVDDAEAAGAEGLLLLFVLVLEPGLVLDDHGLLFDVEPSLFVHLFKLLVNNFCIKKHQFFKYANYK